MFFGRQEIVYTSDNYYKISKKELEIEQIEYQDISEPEKMSHNIIANQLLEKNEIRVYENTLYRYENGVYKKKKTSLKENYKLNYTCLEICVIFYNFYTYMLHMCKFYIIIHIWRCKK